MKDGLTEIESMKKDIEERFTAIKDMWDAEELEVDKFIGFNRPSAFTESIRDTQDQLDNDIR